MYGPLPQVKFPANNLNFEIFLIFPPSYVVSKGPSINDVSPKGEGGGYKKCPKRRRLLVDLRRQREGGGREGTVAAANEEPSRGSWG